MRTLAFISDPLMAVSLHYLGTLPPETVYASDYVACIRELRARPFDRLVLGAVAGHCPPRFMDGHPNARDAGEVVEYMVTEVPRDFWPAAVLVVNASADYFAHISRRLRAAGIPCELVEVLA